jgi:plastocyanin
MPLRRTLLAAFLLLLSGRGSASAHGTTIRVVIQNLEFSPAEVTAKVGDTIEWVNKDVLLHTATDKGGAWDVSIDPGKTGRLVLDTAGTFEYDCKYHPNMKGKIVVAKASQH